MQKSVFINSKLILFTNNSSYFKTNVVSLFLNQKRWENQSQDSRNYPNKIK